MAIKRLMNMMANLIVPNNFIQQIKDNQDAIEAAQKTPVTVESLADIADDMGSQRSGEFLALVTGDRPTDEDAYGAFLSAYGEEFNGELYNVGGVNQGVLQFGLRSSDGAAIFANGDGVVDQQGIDLNGIRYALRHYAEDINGLNPRYGAYEMYYDDLQGPPSLGITYQDAESTANLLSNGDFETGDTTGWTVDHGHVLIGSDAAYAGAFGLRGFFTFVGIGDEHEDITSDRIAITSMQSYSFDGFAKKSVYRYPLSYPPAPTPPPYSQFIVYVKWYDDPVAGILLRTDTIGTITAGVWTQFFKNLTAPAGAQSCEVDIYMRMWEIVGGHSAFGYFYIDEITVRQVTTIRRLSFTPDLTYYDGNASCGMFPKSCTVFAHDFLVFDSGGISVSLLLSNSASQARFGYFIGITAGDCNNGDRYKCNMMLDAGVYDFNFYGVTNAQSAIVDLYIDGTLVYAGLDLYTAGTAYDTTLNMPDISVLGSGSHLVELVVNGKNASSSDYRVILTYLSAKQDNY